VKAQHVILCDAGCYEVGNELSEDWHIRLAADEARAERLFKDACRYCRRHVKEQYALIESDPALELTSDYYWTALWLRLPAASDVDAGNVYQEIARGVDDDHGVAPLVARFEGEGKELSDVLDDLTSLLDEE
jgi:hypothetical protein